jgi:SOS-response transcriptional repressor LexA
MTELQLRALDFIRQRIKETRLAPSFAEIQRYLGLSSKSGVHRILEALAATGKIRRHANRARSIELLDEVDLSAVPTALLLDEIDRRLKRTRSMRQEIGNG